MILIEVYVGWIGGVNVLVVVELDILGVIWSGNWNGIQVGKFIYCSVYWVVNCNDSWSGSWSGSLSGSLNSSGSGG